MHTEDQCFEKSLLAISESNWTVGEMASRWTLRYARGRTDADFAAVLGISPEHVHQCRLVWDRFQTIRSQYPSLLWKHFSAALDWDDPCDCLGWAEERKATVAEMRAWRRAGIGA
jgi:hypothetical protein